MQKKGRVGRIGNTATLLFLILTVFLGCAGPSSLMKQAPDGEVVGAPAPDRARIVFLRPSGIGFGVQAKVIDVTSENEPVLVGFVGAKTSVAYETSPGERLFMAMGGENTPFMMGQLEAGKTYYAKVTPLIGLLYARFSMTPIRSEDLDSPDFGKWIASSTLYRNSEESHQWLTDNLDKVKERRAKHLPKWMKKPQEKRDELTLNPDDGRP